MSRINNQSINRNKFRLRFSLSFSFCFPFNLCWYCFSACTHLKCEKCLCRNAKLLYATHCLFVTTTTATKMANCSVFPFLRLVIICLNLNVTFWNCSLNQCHLSIDSKYLLVNAYYETEYIIRKTKYLNYDDSNSHNNKIQTNKTSKREHRERERDRERERERMRKRKRKRESAERKREGQSKFTNL